MNEQRKITRIMRKSSSEERCMQRNFTIIWCIHVWWKIIKMSFRHWNSTLFFLCVRAIQTCIWFVHRDSMNALHYQSSLFRLFEKSCVFSADFSLENRHWTFCEEPFWVHCTERKIQWLKYGYIWCIVYAIVSIVFRMKLRFFALRFKEYGLHDRFVAYSKITLPATT